MLLDIDNSLIFVAGGTGLAGASIIKYITENYPNVKIRATFLNTEPFIKHEKVEYVRGDLRDKEDCKRLVRGCDLAIMTAAITGGANFILQYPYRYINDNIFINAQLLETFYFENIKRVVYVGSATVYQEFDGHIKEEELDLNKEPCNPYFGVGWVGRFIEKLCKFWYDKYGLEILIARVSNIYGPYAKFDPLTSNFIPALIRKAVDKMDPFEVWGSPEVTRDVIFSYDFARAIVLLLNNNNITFDIFNIGSGQEISVGEVVELVLKHTNHNPKKIEYMSDKPTTIKYRIIDPGKAKSVLGWEPQYTIEEGIKITIEWWKKNMGWWKK